MERVREEQRQREEQREEQRQRNEQVRRREEVRQERKREILNNEAIAAVYCPRTGRSYHTRQCGVLNGAVEVAAYCFINVFDCDRVLSAIPSRFDIATDVNEHLTLD